MCNSLVGFFSSIRFILFLLALTSAGLAAPPTHLAETTPSMPIIVSLKLLRMGDAYTTVQLRLRGTQDGDFVLTAPCSLQNPRCGNRNQDVVTCVLVKDKLQGEPAVFFYAPTESPSQNLPHLTLSRGREAIWEFDTRSFVRFGSDLLSGPRGNLARYCKAGKTPMYISARIQMVIAVGSTGFDRLLGESEPNIVTAEYPSFLFDRSAGAEDKRQDFDKD